MSDATRRGFLVIAGAGAAATVGAVAGSKLTGSHQQDPPAPQPLSAADLPTAESFVVHVKDVKAGRLAIMVGHREVLVTDRELAARLAGAIG